jgi:hypothetical protein
MQRSATSRGAYLHESLFIRHVDLIHRRSRGEPIEKRTAKLCGQSITYA